ncbi:MAG TPA: hypothetical protein DCE52_01715 [Rhodobacteraceae bacterium]|jgi:hypothetical protein|nr:hypothetical protein [Paracoccaceae bacterium]
MTDNTNPLGKYYRQPQIYVKLPSNGKYYSPDVFIPTETGEIPILPMTAKDELAFKTPDAMMNGQSTVDVIKSCVPAFKNPWKMVNYDTDTLLLAIRIATYGETMDINFAVPVTNESTSTTVNLPALLETVSKIDPQDHATTKSGFKIRIQPLTYDKLSKIQIAQFEQQKIYTNVVDSGLTEDQKTQRFAESYKKMQNINVELLIESIAEITTPEDQTVSDGKQIFDFIANCDTKITREIENVLNDLRSQCSIKPLQLKATEDQIKKGVPASYEVPVTFDTANFFG